MLRLNSKFLVFQFYESPQSQKNKIFIYFFIFLRQICHNKGAKFQYNCSLFLDLWNLLVPWVVIAKPGSDLCWTCQKFTETLSGNPNPNPHDEKQTLVDQYQQHLNEARKNRDYYKLQTTLARSSFETLEEYSPFVTSVPCSFDGDYSWDFAQQLHYPTNPQQPGPIYFKTARKCGLFGVVNEGSGHQFNYLIDEAVAVGKGANCTISYVHHYSENHGMGKKKGLFHADNCAGKSKFEKELKIL